MCKVDHVLPYSLNSGESYVDSHGKWYDLYGAGGSDGYWDEDGNQYDI